MKECPQYKAKPGHEHQAHSVEGGVPGRVSSWLADTGTTDHIVPTCVGLLDYVKYDTPKFLTVANGGSAEIVGEGTAIILLPSGFTFELYNVKHVPKATKRLLSVGKACEDGIDVIIKGQKCYLQDSEGRRLCFAEVELPYYWVTDLNLTTSEVSESLPVSDTAKTVT